jgi:hypothetical protein
MLNPTEKQDPNINWQDLSFRRRSRTTEGSGNDPRFVIGLVVFVSVALLFPWYAYEVVMYALERDATKALNDFGIETQKQVDAANKEAERRHSAALEFQQRQRVAGVRVMGVSSGGDLPTVLVSLGNSNTYEAERSICQQAGAWLKRNVSGMTLRLQRHRGNQPAADAGEITCPLGRLLAAP